MRLALPAFARAEGEVERADGSRMPIRLEDGAWEAAGRRDAAPAAETTLGGSPEGCGCSGGPVPRPGWGGLLRSSCSGALGHGSPRRIAAGADGRRGACPGNTGRPEGAPAPVRLQGRRRAGGDRLPALFLWTAIHPPVNGGFWRRHHVPSAWRGRVSRVRALCRCPGHSAWRAAWAHLFRKAFAVSNDQGGSGNGFGPKKPKATFGDVMLGIPAGGQGRDDRGGRGGGGRDGSHRRGDRRDARAREARIVPRAEIVPVRIVRAVPW